MILSKEKGHADLEVYSQKVQLVLVGKALDLHETAACNQTESTVNSSFKFKINSATLCMECVQTCTSKYLDLAIALFSSFCK